MMVKFNLVDSFFDKRHSFEAAVLCSYTLDLNFFENYLLKLNGLYACDDIALFVDTQTYTHFQQAGYMPHALNRRYLVSWLQAPGVFHTKLYLLASTKKALIGIGSANLTREGIASNLELLATFEVTEQDQTFAPLLGHCINYVQRLAQLTQSQRAKEQVAALAECCSSLVQETEGTLENYPQLLHNLDKPLWDEIIAVLGDQSFTKIQVVSPFFDGELAPLRELQTYWPECPVEIHIQQHKSNFPTEQFNNLSAVVSLYHDIDRYLHGKAILFHTPEQIYLFMGSANFTKPALLKVATKGNFEIGIIGIVDSETADTILQPTGQTAVPVTTATDIQVNRRPEFPPQGKAQIPYLTQAVLERGEIQISCDPTIDSSQFQPKRYQLIDFSENSLEGTLSSSSTIALTSSMRQKVQGRLGLQLIGVDGQGQERLSNVVWVIEWDERGGDGYGRQLRRIYSDPSELFNILEEIMVRGDDRDLLLFLQRFDIPLDLLLPPRLAQGSRSVKSRGNVIGELSLHQSKFFSNNVLAAYDACLDRLYAKMKKHLAELQPDKIGNFVLIFNSFLVLMDHVNSSTHKRYDNKSTITNEDWLLIRNYYDMLLKQTTAVWDLVWGKNGYRNQINTRLMEQREDETETIVLFESYLLAEYERSVEELQEFVLRPLRTFTVLQTALRIGTKQGKRVQPKVFPNRHHYLESPQLTGLQQRISRVHVHAFT